MNELEFLRKELAYEKDAHEGTYQALIQTERDLADLREAYGKLSADYAKLLAETE